MERAKSAEVAGSDLIHGGKDYLKKGLKTLSFFYCLLIWSLLPNIHRFTEHKCFGVL